MTQPARRDYQTLKKRRSELPEAIGAIDFLIEAERKRDKQKKHQSISKIVADDGNTLDTSGDFVSSEIPLEDDFLKTYEKPPRNWPTNTVLPTPQGLWNDHSFLKPELSEKSEMVSICILTYNRHEYLERTLAAICTQDYPLKLIEVIVSDDGSATEESLAICRDFSNKIKIKYTWHPDSGFTVAKARNNAVSLASHEIIILLDVDMLPGRSLVSSYAAYFIHISKLILIGPRKYVDASRLKKESILNNQDYESLLKEVSTNNDVADLKKGGKSIDWRLPVFESTNNLITEAVPFRAFASGNVCFSKKNFYKAGRFDERFCNWGYEDTELGFRFFNNGLYFLPVLSALAFHQEPPGGINETNRSEGKKISAEHFASVCPLYRHIAPKRDLSEYEVPKVSIYIPAFNCEKTIERAIDSALSQTERDIEVVICNDGSTDRTLSILERKTKEDSRVRFTSQKNSGIGAASNAAVSLCRGLFIGQLDSDDILAKDAIEICLSQIEKNRDVGLVYTSYYNYNEQTGEAKCGYNYPAFTREKLLTAMIVHHFRFFRRLYWARTEGFNEHIKNAVDYDMYLKLSEVCKVVHINKRSYIRCLHGGNTSIVDFNEQMKNTSKVVTRALARSKLPFAARLKGSSTPELEFIEQ